MKFTCNDSALLGILSVVKRIMNIIQIIVPILLIIWGAISFIKLIKDPEEKNGIKKIINQFLAAAIVFFIPVIINILMTILGEKTSLSSCWNEASAKVTINTTYYSINQNENKKFLPDTKKYESGALGISMNSSNAKSIPSSVLAGAPHSNLSVVVSDDKGNILAQKDPDVLREGGSTAKVFTGLAAVKLLDPKKDKVLCTKYAQNMPYMGDPDVRVGDQYSVAKAATKDFPGSSNITASNIAIAIGKKYNNCSSDEDAYNKGMEKINAFLKSAGCKKTQLISSSGVNYNYTQKKWGYFDHNGYAKGKYGETASDLALVATLAMEDEYFASGIKGRNSDGIFFIKSGTQAYKHGVWGFNYKGKRYYIAILGFNHKVDGDTRGTVSKSIYNWAIKSVI